MFQHYHWAANARALTHWQEAYPEEPKDTAPSRLAIEPDKTDNSPSATLDLLKRLALWLKAHYW